MVWLAGAQQAGLCNVWQSPRQQSQEECRLLPSVAAIRSRTQQLMLMLGLREAKMMMRAALAALPPSQYPSQYPSQHPSQHRCPSQHSCPYQRVWKRRESIRTTTFSRPVSPVPLRECHPAASSCSQHRQSPVPIAPVSIMTPSHPKTGFIVCAGRCIQQAALDCFPGYVYRVRALPFSSKLILAL